jgi:hypothetical protein
LEKVSKLLADFTYSDLKAAKFTHVADDWFASVNYTVVSSLGSAPELQEVEDQDEYDTEGHDDASNGSSPGKVSVVKRLMSAMSPRGMADPLLYVLAKSLPRYVHRQCERPQPVSNGKEGLKDSRDLPSWVYPVFGLAAGVLVIVLVLALVALFSWAWSDPANDSPNARPPVNSRAPSRRSATQHSLTHWNRI